MPMPANRKLDANTVKASLPDGHGKNDAAVSAALAQVNQDAIYDEEAASLTVEIWDRTSPINGVPAEHFLARDDVPDTGDIYLVRRDDQVVVFQPHEPEVAGITPIREGQGRIVGRKHADTLAAERARRRALGQVAERLGVTPSNRAG